jgi:hypothetical protein
MEQAIKLMPLLRNRLKRNFIDINIVKKLSTLHEDEDENRHKNEHENQQVDQPEDLPPEEEQLFVLQIVYGITGGRMRYVQSSFQILTSG